MGIIGEFLKDLLCEGACSVSDVNDAIDSHRIVNIRYLSDGGHEAEGTRSVGVVAYGLTKSGNECIRAFEYRGDSLGKVVPSYKLFRLDRITSWKPTRATFVKPPDEQREPFNYEGDKSMASVFKVADFSRKWKRDNKEATMSGMTNPKMKGSASKSDVDREDDTQMDNDAKAANIDTKRDTASLTNGPKTKKGSSVTVKVGDVKDTMKKARQNGIEVGDDELDRIMESIWLKKAML